MRDTTRNPRDYVQCPICSWACRHHGKRSDGLSVSWRTPADIPASGNPTDRRFIRQFAQMRFHARGHFSEVIQGKVEAERFHLALAFIPNFRKSITGQTNEERESERKKRRRVQGKENGIRYRKRLKREREEEKIREVCSTLAFGRNSLIVLTRKSIKMFTATKPRWWCQWLRNISHLIHVHTCFPCPPVQ